MVVPRGWRENVDRQLPVWDFLGSVKGRLHDGYTTVSKQSSAYVDTRTNTSGRKIGAADRQGGRQRGRQGGRQRGRGRGREAGRQRGREREGERQGGREWRQGGRQHQRARTGIGGTNDMGSNLISRGVTTRSSLPLRKLLFFLRFPPCRVEWLGLGLGLGLGFGLGVE